MKRFMIGVLGLVVVSFIASVGLAQEPSVISEGKRVKFEYSLKVDGKVIESQKGKDSLEYIHGQGQIIPGLSKALEGLKVGDEKVVIVKPQDGYGDVVEEAIQTFPKAAFGEDVTLTKGMVIELEDPEQGRVPAVVWDVKDDEVVLNFNHPLAGKTLEFDVKIIEIE